MQWFKRFVREDEGTEAAEWALMVVVLALAILGASPNLQSSLGGALESVGSNVDSRVDGAFAAE